LQAEITGIAILIGPDDYPKKGLPVLYAGTHVGTSPKELLEGRLKCSNPQQLFCLEQQGSSLIQ
jgi:hypothetical protein